MDIDPYNLETPKIKLQRPNLSYLIVDKRQDEYGSHGKICIISSMRYQVVPALSEYVYVIDREIPAQRSKIKIRLNPLKGKIFTRIKSKPPTRYKLYISEDRADRLSTYLSKLSPDRHQAMMMSLDLGLFPSGKDFS